MIRAEVWQDGTILHGPFPFAFLRTIHTLSGRKTWHSTKSVKIMATPGARLDAAPARRAVVLASNDPAAAAHAAAACWRVLADRSAHPATLLFEDCACMNIGSFGTDGSFALYRPATRECASVCACRLCSAHSQRVRPLIRRAVISAASTLIASGNGSIKARGTLQHAIEL
jgi:hypothetical protein